MNFLSYVFYVKTVSFIPYETVYSWVARSHCRYGVGLTESTFKAIFRTQRIRIHPYLPSYLFQVSQVSTFDVNKILSFHTLHPLFRYFENDKSGILKQQMLANKGAAIAASHIPSSSIEIPLSHSYCSLCAQEQRVNKGFSFFDIRFQIPGVEACPVHFCHLTRITCGDGGIDRLITLPKANVWAYPCKDITVRFAAFCFGVYEALVLCPRAKFNKSNYLIMLDRKGYLTRCGNIRLKQLKQSLKLFYKEIELPEGAYNLLDFNFIGPLLRNKTHFSMHPLKHLLLGFWLFDAKASIYFDELKLTEQIALPLEETADADELIIKGLKSGISLNKLEKQTGRSRCYIRRLAELNNIFHQSNRLSFDRKVRDWVILQAQLGRHRKIIAENVGVGIGYVEQVISNTPGLAEWRKNFKKQQKIALAVKEIIQARYGHPEWLRKDVKFHCNQAFFYLYRNNRALLESILPAPEVPILHKLDWSKEDDRLYIGIKQLKHPLPKSLSALGRALRDKGHLNRKLNLLPKTKQLLHSLGIIK
ncbi:TnsD family transposase [Catenovulum sp. 2E275]|uniref:TnsD family transposase n=1 Tax=Catenovulum sp. 2E275 TaxID=2980497 RepID=UPI0021D2FB10|nr:TnsD family transposase [Catenovulum sp. 2E275]MCU4675368.1 TnsD family transposase [Catenovulum sp. 2E275]